MTDTKHTPGPWVIVTEYGDMRIKSAEGQSLMCDMTYYPWVPEKIEDWRLIAAAPDLLDALEDIARWSRRANIALPSPAIYAAIAKAKGETK